jgi:peptidoglycan/xylan/chitin deacetylase (PgdA/CDA1 family)
MTQPKTLFLMYHELELPNRNLCDSSNGYIRYVLQMIDFYEHMSYLNQQGFLGSTVSDCLNFSNSNNKQIAITFDDGCETDLIGAAPILKEFNFKATFFVVAGFLGKPGYLTPSQLQELSNAGFEIGSHSMTHRYLSDLNNTELYFEINQSKNHLEQLIGKSINHFSCPGGRWSHTAAQIAMDCGYLSLSTSQIGVITKNSPLFSLSRFPIMRQTTQKDLEQICHCRGIALRQARENVFSVAKTLLGNSLYEKVRSKLLNHSPQKI